jgi:AraC family transcriptional regulator of adaptative response / DNA-3-methyladenine glycosylase II
MEVEATLPYREPYDVAAMLDFLGRRAVPGVEAVDADGYRRTLRLPHGPATVALLPSSGLVRARLRLSDPRDRAPATSLARRLLDLDADPAAIARTLQGDPLLAPLVARRPGVRVPGHVDGFELAVRAILGQQVTVAGAVTLAGRIVARLGEPLGDLADAALTRLFPTPAAMAADDLAGIGLTGARITALRALAAAMAEGRLDLSPGADPELTRKRLLALPGVGPWTHAYVAMRALADPDQLPVTDLGIRQAMSRLGAASDARSVAAQAERWRPFRSYAALQLWTSLGDAPEPQ